MTHKEWFSVDVQKWPARVRSRPLGEILKELPANSLDGQATEIELACRQAADTRRDSRGFRAFGFRCTDNGMGCSDPEILRRVGSSTSDLKADTRGRFGQGLIDVLAICDWAEVKTLTHRLVFDKTGCQVSTLRQSVQGLVVEGLLRHGGDGLDELEDYFISFVLPTGVAFRVNGRDVPVRSIMRTIPEIKLQTVIYNPQTERVSRPQR